MFGHFRPNIGILALFSMPDQKTMQTRCLGGFSVMWVTKLLISPVKKGFFAQNWHFFILGWLIWCPIGGLVGGGAWAVSRKTPFYFIGS